MKFDYKEMQDTASSLIKEFGNPCILNKLEKTVFNPATKKNEPVYTEYKGDCVRKTYTAEMIGMLSNIIKSGDVEFKCVFDDKTVVPTEGKDKIIFGGITYNILQVSNSTPDGDTVLVYTLQARRV